MKQSKAYRCKCSLAANVMASNLVLTQWVTVGDVDVDIGANPSAEEAEEGTESTSRKVVDVVDSFRLVVCSASVCTHTEAKVCADLAFNVGAIRS